MESIVDTYCLLIEGAIWKCPEVISEFCPIKANAIAALNKPFQSVWFPRDRDIW